MGAAMAACLTFGVTDGIGQGCWRRCSCGRTVCVFGWGRSRVGFLDPGRERDKESLELLQYVLCNAPFYSRAVLIQLEQTSGPG